MSEILNSDGSQLTDTPKKETTAHKIAEGSKDNAGALAVGLPVIGLWILTTHAGLEIPVEVAGAISGILGAVGGAIGARVRKHL